MGVRFYRQRFRRAAVADRALGGGFAGIGASTVCARLRLEDLRVVVSGREQEPPPALVRYDQVRQSRKGEEFLHAAEEGFEVGDGKRHSPQRARRFTKESKTETPL